LSLNSHVKVKGVRERKAIIMRNTEEDRRVDQKGNKRMR